ncbi:hypothetical protein DOM21_01945 [Bacteriovorax stolpii]|uniref:Uncharacterized protein n=1 Tax=Bacteriovorax stolpii TaxID=960 RepID=A0A2K9NW95_BACTC|nr:hypothetical protein [Bacteriovorax stolpii]AUN99770.1 hypothetical protein C0V70_16980 [Bacteriovorax stolpii]QDK40236.1 hypothetical protein DOM21_01945 [Bacteriovorax stolpii]TDP54343.1 hypothetical protein C8D79_1639 [Bacteriovorax stolpii]
MLKAVSFVFLSFLLASQAVYSSSRVDSVVSDGAIERLNKISALKSELVEGQKNLDAFELKLLRVNEEHKAHQFFFETRKVASIATVVSFSMLGVGMLSATARIPKPTSLIEKSFITYGSVAILPSAIAAAGSQIGFMLTKNESDKLRVDIKNIKSVLKIKNKELESEVKVLCGQEPRHQLCY